MNGRMNEWTDQLITVAVQQLVLKTVVITILLRTKIFNFVPAVVL